MSNDKQKEWEERYKSEKSEKSKAVYASLICYSVWGITIVFLGLMYSKQGYDELYNQATPESTFFTQISSFLLIVFALFVTVLYIRFKSNSGKSIAKNQD